MADNNNQEQQQQENTNNNDRRKYYNLNYKFDKPDDRDLKFHTIFASIPKIKLPAKIDLTKSVGKILDQYDIGSCVSNSMSYCMRHLYRKLEASFCPSRLFIYWNGRFLSGESLTEDTGLSVRDGCKSVASYLACGEENNWPYKRENLFKKPTPVCYIAAKSHKPIKYININSSSIYNIKKCIYDGYLVSFGALLYDSFMSEDVAKTGIVLVPKTDSEECLGGHCMTIVGYDDIKQCFIVANSWSESWGIRGYCLFPYKYMLNHELCNDFWTLRFA